MEDEHKGFDFKTWAIKHGLKRGTVYVLQTDHCCSEENLRKLTNMAIDTLDISKAQKQALGRAVYELVEGDSREMSFEFSEGPIMNEVDSAAQSPTEEQEEQDKPVEPDDVQDKPVEPDDEQQKPVEADDHEQEQQEGEEMAEPEKENVAMETANPSEASPRQDEEVKAPGNARRKKVPKNKGRVLILYCRIHI